MKILKVLSLLVSISILGYLAWQFLGSPNGKKYDFNKKQNIYFKGEGLIINRNKLIFSIFNIHFIDYANSFQKSHQWMGHVRLGQLGI